MSNVSLFSRYSNKENDISNYCASLMKMIYENSPLEFNKLVEVLFSDYGTTPSFGPSFSQQASVPRSAGTKSVADIYMSQPCVNVFVETKKNCKNFTQAQIGNYIDSIYNKNCCCDNYLLLLSNYDGNDPLGLPVVAHAIQAAQGKNVTIIPVDFELLVDAMSECCGGSFLTGLVDEFRNYLDELGLLPAWKYRMEVVNCTASLNVVQNFNAYFCPIGYTHKRAAYFGCYNNKNIAHVHKIKAVMRVTFDHVTNGLNAAPIYNNLSSAMQKTLEIEAINVVNANCLLEVKNKHDMQVFLLDERNDISVAKTSPGGMQSSKMYIEQINRALNSSGLIANRLNNSTWTDKAQLQSLLK